MFILINGFLFIICLIQELLYFQFLSKNVSTVKYFQESEFAKEPIQATDGAAGYDLFAAEAKTIIPHSSESVCLDLRWAIPKRFFGKVFPRSSMIKNYNVTVDAGLIDLDYSGLVYVLFVNDSEQTFTIRTDDRLVQAVFLEKFDVKFEKVNNIEQLGKTKRGNGGFGSTGITVIKKMKPNEEEEHEETDTEITSEEAIMSTDKKVIIKEKITVE